MRRILTAVFFLLANGVLVSSPAFRYEMAIEIYLDGVNSDVEVEFLLNSPSRFDWRMYYGPVEPLNYLHLRFRFPTLPRNTESTGVYPNKFQIDRNVAYSRILSIGTDSDAFLNADPVEQFQFLFAELKFRIDGVQYSLDLKNLTSEALVKRGGWVDEEYYRPITSITLSKDFLETYCIIETSGG